MQNHANPTYACSLHTGGVASSILAAPTIFPSESATFRPGANPQIGRIRQLPADQSRNPAGESGENPGSGFARRSEPPLPPGRPAGPSRRRATLLAIVAVAQLALGLVLLILVLTRPQNGCPALVPGSGVGCERGAGGQSCIVLAPRAPRAAVPA